MAQYPVSTDDGVKSALNYLLSGPSGLGQDFAGFSTYVPAYLTGFYRQPFAGQYLENPPLWTIDPIDVTGAGGIPASGPTKYFYVNFVPQATPPFKTGQAIRVRGIVDGSEGGDFYNGRYTTPGVVSCTTSQVIIETRDAYDYSLYPYVSDGTVSLNLVTSLPGPTYTSTDCNARVTVSGPTDRVFVSGQNTIDINYTCTETSAIIIELAINRYRGIQQTTAGEVDYIFVPDGDNYTIGLYDYEFTGLEPGSGTLTINPTFISIIDQPNFGYYWYIMEIAISNTTAAGDDLPGDFAPITLQEKLRSLTAQVVKQ